ncbi:MAG: peptidylprolyl isomerase [Clostridium sp.]|nr:peptidylprolyl isomerase [Clostridium sp.]
MTATIQMEDGNKIVIALYPDKATNTVQNFIDLCQQKFYDGVIFHRVQSDFVIQGGDKTGTGSGDNGWTINGEFSENGYTQNDLSYDAGVVGMARTSDYNSASSQFFITVTGDSKDSLDGKYAAFGKVIEGMDVVLQYAALVVDANQKPYDPPVIKTITVDTLGQTVPAPVRNITSE